VQRQGSASKKFLPPS